MPSNVGLLDYHQPITGKPILIPADVAEEMKRRLVAEKISKRLYRLFSPDSPFPQLKPSIFAQRFIPSKLPPREAPGCFFQLPQSDKWKRDHRTVNFMH
jgi:hypothetical protein